MNAIYVSNMHTLIYESSGSSTLRLRTHTQCLKHALNLFLTCCYLEALYSTSESMMTSMHSSLAIAPAWHEFVIRSTSSSMTAESSSLLRASYGIPSSSAKCSCHTNRTSHAAELGSGRRRRRLVHVNRRMSVERRRKEALNEKGRAGGVGWGRVG